MGRKLKSISGNGGSSFKDTHGYSKVGGVLKSKDTKMALEKKQLRMNAFRSAAKDGTREALNEMAKPNMRDSDIPLGDQKRYKKIKTRT
jgi:hypothetical protein